MQASININPNEILTHYTDPSLKDAVANAVSPKVDTDPESINKRTDRYFVRMSEIVKSGKDEEVVYGFFVRRPTLSACSLVFEWLKNVAAAQNAKFVLQCPVKEGEWVGGGEALFYLKGELSFLAPLETLLLQKIGAVSVSAYNAYRMASVMPKTPFLAMDARHCAGAEMQEMMAYAAAVGTLKAKAEGAVGFIGNANDYTAGFFGRKQGMGTMPHALVGYAGSTLKAAQLYHERFPEEDLTVLVDYFGHEVSDALEVCNHYKDLAEAGKVMVRLDTHGGRFLEGLDPQKSYDVIERHVPEVIRTYRSETELKHLIGTGVTAASVWHMRDALGKAGFKKVKIIASSGFNAEKCKIMREAKAPIDIVGTGSFLPENWPETNATSDIIRYGDVKRVKVGREFLWNNFKEGF